MISRTELLGTIIELDHKFGRAIGQNKLPMVSYYYGRMTEILNILGRTNKVKDVIPAWVAWNKFSNEFKKSEIYKQSDMEDFL